ncbi:MAG TPA: M15 family metallopeptidase [Microbacterium sp.]|nr:M15 family metallopeptidase [Microbacterium sp.]
MNTALARSRRRRATTAVTATLVVALIALILTVQQALPTASAAPLSPGSAAVADSTAAAGSATAADGLIDGGRVTVFDDVPAVTGLDDALRAALQRAARAAASDGVELRLNSGWRSAAYQRQLLQEAEAEYGSIEEASRWVATADTSEHVTGDAADVGPRRGAEWLGHHGADFGLCRVYANEPWHFELRADAATDGCPRMYADATERRR